MQKNIFILTGYQHFFGQSRKPWVSLDTISLISSLENLGYQVNELSFDAVANHTVVIENAIVFYTFSQRENLRQYIKDVIYHLDKPGITVIPANDLLLCHENKGYQELYKLEKGIGNLAYKYFSSKREIANYDIKYPVVLKTITGSNATGVHLVENKQSLYRVINKLELWLTLGQRIDLFRRRYFRHKQFVEYPQHNDYQDYLQYKDYVKPEIGFVLQEFVPGLNYDYRVVILGERYFVSKRLTRKDDFRASGAKNLTFDFDMPAGLLDYSSNIFNLIGNPTLALDIGEREGKFYLFEFMAVSFGISTILSAPQYFRKEVADWVSETSHPTYETMLAQALHFHIVKYGL